MKAESGKRKAEMGTGNAVGRWLLTGLAALVGLCVWTVTPRAWADGPERFRSVDITNGGFNTWYSGIVTNGPTLTNLTGTTTLTLATGGASNAWFNIGDWYGIPVTIESAVWYPTNTAGMGSATTNGYAIFQFSGAYDLGGQASPPAALNGGGTMPYGVITNLFSLTNTLAGPGLTNYAYATFYPNQYTTNIHFLQWSGFACNQTNTGTNGVWVLKLRWHVFK